MRKPEGFGKGGVPEGYKQNLDELFLNLHGECKLVATHRMKARDIATVFVTQLVNLLSPKAHHALKQSYGEHVAAHLSRQLCKKAIDDERDNIKGQEHLAQGVTVPIEIDGEHIKDQSDLEAVIIELQEVWKGRILVDVYNRMDDTAVLVLKFAEKK